MMLFANVSKSFIRESDTAPDVINKNVHEAFTSTNSPLLFGLPQKRRLVMTVVIALSFGLHDSVPFRWVNSNFTPITRFRGRRL